MNIGQMLKQLNKQRIIYTICAYGMCIVAYLRGAGNGLAWNIGLWSLGFAFLPIILSKYHLKDFCKLKYYIYAIIGACVIPLAYSRFAPATDYRYVYIVAFIDVYLYGFILIRNIDRLREIILAKRELKFNLKQRMTNHFLYATAVFFFFTMTSVNESLWNWYFAVIFLSLFILPFERKDKMTLFISIADALIIFFFVIQGHALLYRPYEDLRYIGMFTNPNINAMFYFAVYIAFLFKYVYERYLNKANRAHSVKVIVTFLFAAAMWSFALLTICRTVLVGFVFTTLFFYIATEFFVFKTNLKGFLLRGVTMFVAFVISFPIVFAAVRYIPPLRHHPIWLDDYTEDTVFSWDPIDSPKYVELSEFIDAFLGRASFNDAEENRKYYDSFYSNEQSYNIDMKTEGLMLVAGKVRKITRPRYDLFADKIGNIVAVASTESDEIVRALAETEEDGGYLVAPLAGRLWHRNIANCKIDGIVIYEYQDGTRPGADGMHPAFLYDNEDTLSHYLGIRKYIYGSYLRNLNWFGHEEEYPKMYIFTDYEILHAHDTYLQIGYCYGIVSGVLFLLINIFAAIFSVYKLKREKDIQKKLTYIFTMLVQIAVMSVSITENIAFPSKMLLTLFFVSLLTFIDTDFEKYRTVKTKNEIPRLLCVISGLIKSGGTENVIMNYYRLIDKTKLHIDFVCHGSKEECCNHPFYKEMKENNSEVFFVTPRFESVAANRAELVKIFTEGGYDCVHAHGDAANAFILDIARECDIPVRISHCHSTGIQLKITGIKSLLHFVYLQYSRYKVRETATHYMACSRAAAKWLYGNKNVTTGNVYILNNSIELDKYAFNKSLRDEVRSELGVGGNEILIGQVGRLSTLKNQLLTIEMVKRLDKVGIKAVFLGEDNLNGELMDKTKGDNRFIFTGNVTNVERYLNGFDVFVMPSLFEGLPISLIEAQAAGLCCIISDYAHITEEADITGLVRRADINDIDSWVSTLQKCIDDGCLQRTNVSEELAQKGFDISREAQKLEEYLLKQCS